MSKHKSGSANAQIRKKVGIIKKHYGSTSSFKPAICSNTSLAVMCMANELNQLFSEESVSNTFSYIKTTNKKEKEV